MPHQSEEYWRQPAFYNLNPRACTQLSDSDLLSLMSARHLSPMPAQREDLMAILEAADQQSFHRFFDPPAEPASTPSTSPASARQKSTPSHHSHVPRANFALTSLSLFNHTCIFPLNSAIPHAQLTCQPMRSRRPAETSHSSNIFNRTTSPKSHHWSVTTDFPGGDAGNRPHPPQHQHVSPRPELHSDDQNGSEDTSPFAGSLRQSISGSVKRELEACMDEVTKGGAEDKWRVEDLGQIRGPLFDGVVTGGKCIHERYRVAWSKGTVALTGDVA